MAHSQEVMVSWVKSGQSGSQGHPLNITVGKSFYGKKWLADETFSHIRGRSIYAYTKDWHQV